MKDIVISMPEDVRYIIKTLTSHGYEAYIVGGCVRDEILGRKPCDYDITTSAEPDEVKALFSETIDTGLKHGTVTVRLNHTNYEVTTYRIDGRYADNRHPESVTFTRSLKEDLMRRDFTINALAYNDESGIVDLFGGLRDLDDYIIRAVGVAEDRFREDALRILRALRFSAQLDFKIEENTRSACEEEAGLLANISEERIRDELVKIIMSSHPEKLIDCYELGITGVVLPEFDRMMKTSQENPHHIYDVGTHTVVAMKNSPQDLIVRLTLLFHDSGKPETKTIDERGIAHFYNHQVASERIAREAMKRLRFPTKIIDTVCFLVLHHGDEFIPEPKYVRRAIHKISPELFPRFLDVQRADISAQSPLSSDCLKDNDRARELYAEYMREQDCFTLKDLAVDGDDLLKKGYSGKVIGQILSAMLDHVVDHPEDNDKSFLLEHIDMFIPDRSDR